MVTVGYQLREKEEVLKQFPFVYGSEYYLADKQLFCMHVAIHFE